MIPFDPADPYRGRTPPFLPPKYAARALTLPSSPPPTDTQDLSLPRASAGGTAVPPTAPPAPELPLSHPTALPRVNVPSANEQRLSDLQAHGSGISNIHNPVGRTFARIGDILAGTFAPRAEMLIPGTEGNYAMHLARANSAVKGEQEGAENEARTHLQRAQAENQEAEAQSRLHPQPKEEMEGKTVTTDEGIFQWNPQTHRYDVKVGGAPEKAEAAGKTITTDQGIMQWNPETNRYDIEAGQAPGAKGGSVHQLDDGTFIIAHPDGSATPVTVNGQPAKGKTTVARESPEQQFIDEFRSKNPKASIADAEKAFKAIQPPERPPQTMMLVPGENGAMTAQVVRPGQTVAPGSVTPQGASSANVKTQEQTAAEQKAKADAQKEYQLAQQLVKNPTPTNDVALVMRYIGATKPDSLGKLRLNQNEINLVLGTRSLFGDIEALAEKVRNGQKLTPKQRQDMLDTMKILADGGTPQAPGGVPKVGETFNGHKVTGIRRID